MNGEKIVKSACLFCPPGCGIDIHVRDNKPVKVESMVESVVGPICIKGEVIPEWFQTELKERRVLHPLQKVNGNWREITWDQALDTIAENLTNVKRKYGPEALASYIGTTESFHDYNYLARRFFLAFGSPSYYNCNSICYFTKIVAGDYTYGGYAPPTFIGTKCIIVWAANPTESVPFAGDAIVLAKTQKGVKLIVIDPRRTLLAKAADIHLQLRPGTDTALALAFLNVIISKKLYDKEFVEKYTFGFDKLAEHVKQYTPEKVAQICDVPPEKILEAARIYSTQKPSTIFQGNSLDNVDNGFQSCRGITCLISVTGNLDVRGGSTLMPFHIFSKWALEDWEKEGLPMPRLEPAGKPEGPFFYDSAGHPSVVGLFRGMVEEKPYPIKALLVDTGNPMVTLGDTNYLRQGIDKLEFMAVHDVFMTETAQLADIVLPAANYFEQQSIYQYVGRPMVILLNKAIEPPEDCWPSWKVWIELAKRLGMEKYFPWKDVEEFHEKFFCPKLNMTLDDLRNNPGGYYHKKRMWKKYKTEGIATPSGKVELYSERLAMKDYDPLPTYHEPVLSPINRPDLARQYPLIVITGQRILEFAQSMMLGVPTLRGKIADPKAEIHTDTARNLGIDSGDPIIIETPWGKVQMKASLTQYIHPKVVSLPYGFGGLANANYLTSFKTFMPEVGMPAYRALPCRVTKALMGEPSKVVTV
jgi:anaerobic selenocysteine-containing dehydrogenase